MKKFICSFLFLVPVCMFAQTYLTRTVQVKAQKSFQNYEHFKRLTLDSPDSEAEYINGFDFEWGYEYVLEVEEKKLAETLSDGSRYDYSFKSIVSKKEMPDSTEFRLHLDGRIYHYEGEEDDESLIPLNDSTFVYLEDVEIEVPAALLPEFKRIVSAEKSRNADFKFVNGSRIRLIRFH